jgi:DNA-binding LacI/PurR family transcriptional regulator/DNA-binding transcriptional regulator YhcF (GntR family)
MNGERYQPLVLALTEQLARAPSHAGARLLPGRQIARLFGVSHDWVRRAIDQLVEQELLVRRQGSGVYVRKMPPAATVPSAKELAGAATRPPVPFSIFVAEKRPLRLRPEARQVQLHLGLWIGRDTPKEQTSATNRGLMEGVIQRIQERGHRLTIHRLGTQIETPKAAQVAAQLRAHPHDGHILHANWTPVMRAAFGEARPPCACLGHSFAADDDGWPMISIDLADAIRRGVQRLAAEGFQRIGLINLGTPGHPAEPERAVYERAMADLGLPYRAATDAGVELADGEAAARRLFQRAEPPDAVYVADDVVLAGVAAALPELGLTPGRNLGLITLACRGNPLPAGHDWSRLEFDPFQVGRMTVDSLLTEIESAGEQLCSFAHRAAWRPGKTHKRNSC